MVTPFKTLSPKKRRFAIAGCAIGVVAAGVIVASLLMPHSPDVSGVDIGSVVPEKTSTAVPTPIATPDESTDAPTEAPDSADGQGAPDVRLDANRDPLVSADVPTEEQQAIEEAARAAREAVIPEVGLATAKRSATEALPTAQIGSSDAVTDISDRLMNGFGLDVANNDPDGGASMVTVTKDQCLLDWATQNLLLNAGEGKVFTASICGRTAAVLVGGYTTNGRDMLLRSLHSPEHADLQPILFGHQALGYAAVAGPQGNAIMIVVAP